MQFEAAALRDEMQGTIQGELPDDLQGEKRPTAPRPPELQRPEGARQAARGAPAVEGGAEGAIGPRPEGVQRSVGTAFSRLRRSMGHSSTARLVLVLQRWGAPAQAIAAAHHMLCHVCEAAIRPQSARAARVPDYDSEPLEWGRKLMVGEFSVASSDGSGV